jgi:hypothetical protein
LILIHQCEAALKQPFDIKKAHVSELSIKLRIIYFKVKYYFLSEKDLFYFKHATYTCFIQILSFCLLSILWKCDPNYNCVISFMSLESYTVGRGAKIWLDGNQILPLGIWSHSLRLKDLMAESWNKYMWVLQPSPLRMLGLIFPVT